MALSLRAFHFRQVIGDFGVTFLRVLVALLLSGVALHAQEVVVAELPPIVVPGSFELRPEPSTADSFAKYLEKEMEARRAAEEAVSRSPLMNARFWSYIPIPLGAAENNTFVFHTPGYLTLNFLHTERALETSHKQSLFESR